MENLDQELRDQLIATSISFMQSVSEIYGAERGMELWSTIADTVDPALKGEVFVALLTGNYQQNKLRVKNPFLGAVSNKGALIRCLRNYDSRNLSLKDAKDIADRLETGGSEILEVRHEIRPTFAVELRKLGIVV
jgi:hypothetical protein